MTKMSNEEIASRLRGMADLIAACSSPVRLRMGIKMRVSDAKEDRFEHPVTSFEVLSDKLLRFTATGMLRVLGEIDSPEKQKLKDILESVLAHTPAD